MKIGYSGRNYATADERSWLRCRVLSFLETSYFDNVLPAKPTIEALGFGLVTCRETNRSAPSGTAGRI